MPEHDRRVLLRRIGAAVMTGGLAGVAGCSDTIRVGVGEDDESTRTRRPTDQPTRRPSPTPTPTAIDTMAATETSTPTPAGQPELVTRYSFDGHVRDAAGSNDLSSDPPTFVEGPQGSEAAAWEGRFAASPELYTPTTEDTLTFAFWLGDDGTRST